MHWLSVLLAVGVTQRCPALSVHFMASAPGVGCLRAKLQPVCTPPYGLSCLAPQFIKEETQTGEDIAGECGPVLLALTPVLARN